ncbi:hypothetical protein J6590_005292 [Homalodisca vitripennis]|nr:hypothetical protein J6590_005292 [Homalodisca vitripennis]
MDIESYMEPCCSKYRVLPETGLVYHPASGNSHSIYAATFWQPLGAPNDLDITESENSLSSNDFVPWDLPEVRSTLSLKALGV